MNDFSNPMPQSYAAWRHCITIDCGIPLTLAFIEAHLGGCPRMQYYEI
ncbi:MAG: hypothetical protein QX197_06630 [Methylococcaceae bacterium]